MRRPSAPSARHPDTLTSINNLASLLDAQAKPDKAEPLYSEALEGSREVLCARHPRTLIAINNIALLLQAQGKLDAEPLYREALKACREKLGSRRPRTLTMINNHEIC